MAADPGPRRSLDQTHVVPAGSTRGGTIQPGSRMNPTRSNPPLTSDLADPYLVDIRALDEAGYDFEAALRAATTKDASLTPGQLAWAFPKG